MGMGGVGKWVGREIDELCEIVLLVCAACLCMRWSDCVNVHSETNGGAGILERGMINSFRVRDYSQRVLEVYKSAFPCLLCSSWLLFTTYRQTNRQQQHNILHYTSTTTHQTLPCVPGVRLAELNTLHLASEQRSTYPDARTAFKSNSNATLLDSHLPQAQFPPPPSPAYIIFTVGNVHCHAHRQAIFDLIGFSDRQSSVRLRCLRENIRVRGSCLRI